MTDAPAEKGQSNDDALLRHFSDLAIDHVGFGGIGVAVSGGSDSVAMLHLLAEAAHARSVPIMAATVDHGLRPEARQEAAFVGDLCKNLGVPHDILLWEHGTIAGNMMAMAREARYQLLSAWAGRNGLARVALAHTANDQAETFLMGLSRSAGIDGLSGMRRVFHQNGIAFDRPFLSCTRDQLRGYLVRRGVRWIDDPTNENERFNRVKARRVLQALEPLGITVPLLADVVDHLAMSREALQTATVQAATDIISEIGGGLSFDFLPFHRSGPEICRRLLIGMIRWMNGEIYAPREIKIANLMDAIAERRDATLGGVRFSWKDDRCTVVREPRAFGPPTAVGKVWDNRWHVTGPLRGEVRAVGSDGLAQVANWRACGLSRGIAQATPGIWEGDRLISAPILGFGADYSATIGTPFHRFLLSH